MFSKSRNRPMNANRLALERLEDRTLLVGDVLFAEPVIYRPGGQPASLAGGDVNDDGVVDLFVGDCQCPGPDDQVSVLLGNGDGTFAPSRRFPLPGPHGVMTGGDFDADGDLDLAVTSPRGSEGVYIVLNEGVVGGQWTGFGPPIYIPISEAPQDITTGDFDGDGDLDIAVGRFSSVPVLLNNGVADRQWQGFADPVYYDAGNRPLSVDTGDVDSNGVLDLIVGNFFDGDVSVLLGNGDGSFADAVNYRVGTRPWSVNLGDLDADGDLDVVLNSGTNHVAVLLNNGDGTFAEPVRYRFAGSIGPVLVGDLDGDGDLDIALPGGANEQIRVLINSGDGTFAEQQRAFSRRPYTFDAAIVDLNGDGLPDLAFAHGTGLVVSVFLNITEAPSPGPLPGDANMDGVFNQLDVVQVLQGGKYLTGQPATFAEGDWNGDRVFDQLDIVAALGAGKYSPGSTAASTIASCVDEVLENESALDDIANLP